MASLDFRHLGRGINGAVALRNYRDRTGLAGAHPLWTKREDEVVQRLYPDYRRIMKELPRRSYFALRSRAITLGVVARRHVWTAPEVARLRKLAGARVTNSELFAAFPGMRKQQIEGAIRSYKLRRGRRRLQRTGHPIIDAIRDECFRRNLSMVDLDAMARSGRYFQAQRWASRAPGRPWISRKVARAIDALGGKLTVTWPD